MHLTSFRLSREYRYLASLSLVLEGKLRYYTRHEIPAGVIHPSLGYTRQTPGAWWDSGYRRIEMTSLY